MAEERPGYRKLRKSRGQYVDRRSSERDIQRRNVSKFKPGKRKKGMFNPKAKIDRSQIEVRKPGKRQGHWRTNATKYKLALKKRHKLERKADKEWLKGVAKSGNTVDWRFHQYSATTGFGNYLSGKDLKKKYGIKYKSKKGLAAKGAKNRQKRRMQEPRKQEHRRKAFVPNRTRERVVTKSYSAPKTQYKPRPQPRPVFVPKKKIVKAARKRVRRASSASSKRVI